MQDASLRQKVSPRGSEHKGTVVYQWFAAVDKLRQADSPNTNVSDRLSGVGAVRTGREVLE